MTSEWNWNGTQYLGFEPIGHEFGSGYSAFTGSFDGGNNTILNLFINRSDDHYVGLFSYVGDFSDVKNVGLIDVDILGNQMVGSISGQSDGIVSMSFSTGRISGSSTVGGLIGRNNRLLVNSYAILENLSASVGTAGGLVGRNYGYQPSSCGFGMCLLSANISKSYAILSSSQTVAGVASQNYVQCIPFSENYRSAHINLVYSSPGFPTAQSNGCNAEFYGGNFVYRQGSILKNSTQLIDFLGILEEELLLLIPFNEWDFDEIWAYDETGEINNGYPYLRWQD